MTSPDRVIKFTALEYSEDIDNIDDLEEIMAFTTHNKPTVRVPNVIRVEEVVRIKPCKMDPESLTDVFLLDGDILIADEPFNLFEAKWLSAMHFEPDETWKPLSSKDGEANFRCYLN